MIALYPKKAPTRDQNTVPCIERLNERSSTQAPAGFMEKATDVAASDIVSDRKQVE